MMYKYKLRRMEIEATNNQPAHAAHFLSEYQFSFSVDYKNKNQLLTDLWRVIIPNVQPISLHCDVNSFYASLHRRCGSPVKQRTKHFHGVASNI